MKTLAILPVLREEGMEVRRRDKSAKLKSREERMWNLRMDMLRGFYQRNGHCRVPHYHRLARFVRAIQKAYIDNKLHPRYVQDIKQGGFESEILAMEDLAALMTKRNVTNVLLRIGSASDVCV